MKKYIAHVLVVDEDVHNNGWEIQERIEILEDILDLYRLFPRELGAIFYALNHLKALLWAIQSEKYEEEN